MTAQVTSLKYRNTTLHQDAQPAAALSNRYLAVRHASTALSEGLSAEDCALQSMPDASPIKWHLAHTSWFFETFVLEQAVPGYRHFHPQYRVLFNSYYVTVGERHPRAERGLVSRPGLDDILCYREHVDGAMQALLRDVDALSQAMQALIELGLNHEQQHQELMLTDLKHLFSRNPLQPAYREASARVTGASVPAIQWHDYAGGQHRIGHASDSFAFDNELPSHRVFLERYALGSRLVTNGEYRSFIEDGGYMRADLWLSDGWDAVQAQRWQAPLYWQQQSQNWQVFTLSGTEEINPAEPVCHVSYYESDAYARWAGARLPTEFEWEAAAASLPAEGNLVERGALRPLAVADRQADHPQQMFGDVWEWTSSSYAPYPGYRTAPGAVGEYNGKFMVNQYVLRGGSFATPQSHIRSSYRNFFPAPARWQFMGIRLARD
jgi:ergothioneine biosynthesis protein EgtB